MNPLLMSLLLLAGPSLAGSGPVLDGPVLSLFWRGIGEDNPFAKKGVGAGWAENSWAELNKGGAATALKAGQKVYLKLNNTSTSNMPDFQLGLLLGGKTYPAISTRVPAAGRGLTLGLKYNYPPTYRVADASFACGSEQTAAEAATVKGGYICLQLLEAPQDEKTGEKLPYELVVTATQGGNINARTGPATKFRVEP